MSSKAFWYWVLEKLYQLRVSALMLNWPRKAVRERELLAMKGQNPCCPIPLRVSALMVNWPRKVVREREQLNTHSYDRRSMCPEQRLSQRLQFCLSETVVFGQLKYHPMVAVPVYIRIELALEVKVAHRPN